MLNFLQLNCNRCKAVSANLHANLLTDFSVALLQEPHHIQNKVAGFPGRQVIHAGSEAPRTAIVAGKGCKVWLDPAHSDKDVTTAIVSVSPDSFIYVVSAYFDILRNGDDLSLIHI